MKKIILLLILSKIFISNIAYAGTIKFCFSLDSLSYVDSGYGEDRWASTDDRPFRGAKAYVKKTGDVNWRWQGYLGDGDYSGAPGNGCTGTITISPVNGNYEFKIESYGQIGSDIITIKDETSNDIVSITSSLTITSTSNAKYNISLGAGSNLDEFKVYMAFSHALWYNSVDDIIDPIAIVGPNGCPSGSGNCFSNGLIYIDSSGSGESRKFAMTHELGHKIASISTSGKASGSYCSTLSFTDCSSSGTHAMTSKETSRCAIGEGFGHYYAARTWNDSTQTSCSFRYWTDVTVDCQNGHTDYEKPYMETNCDPAWAGDGTGGSSWDGLGVELDWLRVFWYMDTQSCNSPNTDMSLLTNFLDSTTAWTKYDGYDNINSKANDVSTSNSIKNCWNAAKTVNGVDHPAP